MQDIEDNIVQPKYFAVIDVSWVYEKPKRFRVLIGDWRD